MISFKQHRSTTFLLLVAALCLSVSMGAQRVKRARLTGKPVADSTAVDSLRADSILAVDSLRRDSLRTDSLPSDTAKKKSSLDAPVTYEANDSIVFLQGGNAFLYGAGKVNYEKIELTSDVIRMNMDSSVVYAHGVEDSLGVLQGKPVFKDGDTPYESKEMSYNFKTKKGFINNIVTQQGEGYVTSEESKKGPNDEIYLRHGRYTTCDDTEHPHFYLRLSMAKVRPKKECGVRPGPVGGGGCASAHRRAFRLLPL